MRSTHILGSLHKKTKVYKSVVFLKAPAIVCQSIKPKGPWKGLIKPLLKNVRGHPAKRSHSNVVWACKLICCGDVSLVWEHDVNFNHAMLSRHQWRFQQIDPEKSHDESGFCDCMLCKHHQKKVGTTIMCSLFA